MLHFKIRSKVRHTIEDSLENDYCFRDYRILPAKYFGKIDKPRSINLLRPTEDELRDAIAKFSRDYYGTILIYI